MRSNNLLIALLPVLTAPGAAAQYWAPLGGGVPNIIGGSRVVYGDTVWDRLLVGTDARWVMNGLDSISIMGGAMWNGQVWDSLPGPLDPQCSSNSACAPAFRFMRFKNDLYSSGAFRFQTPSGELNDFFARWNPDSLRWEALECVNPIVGGMMHALMVPPQDTLYFTGYRGSICGFPQSCVFAYDGSVFQPFEPFDVWQGSAGDYVGFVFRFRGLLYMTGLLNEPATGAFYGFLRYNGTSWEPVPGFTTPAPIKDVLIHEDKLYVCGYFFTNTGAPGNMVAVFDGEQWNDMGGGLRYALPNSTSGIALDLHEWNGDIYVAGQFNYAGGVPAQNVARWNGQQWCGMGGHYVTQQPGGQAWSVTTWRDTLYMAGNFITIDGDTMNHVAKWLGEVENCSPLVGVAEHEPPAGTLLPTLLDSEGLWQLTVPEDARDLRVYDMHGRLVLQQRPGMHSTITLDLRPLASGVYVVLCTTAKGGALRAKVYRP